MRRLVPVAVLVLVIALSNAPSGADEPKAVDLTGYWEGSLTVGTVPLRFTFQFRQDPTGGWTGTLQSHDEGLKDLPVREIHLDQRKLNFKVPTARAQYSGTVSDDATRIRGTWEQSITLPLNLKKVDTPLVIRRPQTPQSPFPYIEHQLTIENHPAKVTLAGTLTQPRGDGPFPLLILISGSGPQDRDETLFGHKLFAVIADHLTRQGMAVFRYDDRGTARSTGTFATATTRDLADDALAVVAELRQRPGIDPKRVGLLGHSEGGVIAPIVATESTHIAFIVLLAGTGIPGDELLLMQGRAILKAMGLPEAMAERNLKLNQSLFALIKSDADEKQLMTAGDEYLQGLSSAERLLGGTAATEQVRQGVKQVSSPWMRYFIKYDPRPVLKKVRCPVLALNGSLDLQVPAQANLTAIQNALTEGKNTAVTVREFAGLNHLFQTAKTGLPAEYGTIEETISPEVLDVIQKWIAARVSP